ncbi:MAG: hypothetical protein NXI02_32170 [Rhodobacteraceae bacterium]|nr:hypothetical protein [Paracoccaceae bacterium]
MIEYDPLYCDAIVKRWEAFTGKSVKQVAASRKPMGDDASSNVLLDVAT